MKAKMVSPAIRPGLYSSRFEMMPFRFSDLDVNDKTSAVGATNCSTLKGIETNAVTGRKI